jgi:peptidyl-prolyl cis-trans isomerase SurA
MTNTFRPALLIRLFLFLAVASLPMAPTGASAQTALRIAAVVNDDVISAYDLNARIDLAIVSSGMRDSAEVRRKLAEPILRELVDEKLKMQEAERLGISVSDDELNKALASLEEKNGLPPGGLDAFLESRRIDRTILSEKLEAQIAWLKVVRRRLGRKVTVSDEEIDERIAQMEAQRGRPEHLLAEIYLPVDSPAHEREVAQLADRLFNEIRNGRKFPDIARNFSRSPSAAVGGDLGWVPKGQLPAELEAVVEKLGPGEISPPVRVLDGYYILALRSERTASGAERHSSAVVELQQIFLPLGPNADNATVQSRMAAAKAMVADARTCQDMDKLSKDSASQLSGNLGEIALAKLPDTLRGAVAGLPIGRPSEPIRTRDGVIVLMVCSRKGEDPAQEARKAIHDKLYEQRLLALAEEFLRDLRRQAFVDIRL